MTARGVWLLSEFDQQADNLVRQGYPAAAGISEKEFARHIQPLRERAGGLDGPEVDMVSGRLPFVIVVSSVLVPAAEAMPLVERDGKRGFVQMYPREPADFAPIPGVAIPDAPAYLLVDIDRGGETINVPPRDALAVIEGKGRSPLTIEEGIAVLAHYPEFLRKNNCYSLLGSRAGDQRVPAVWITEGRPRLGWCWTGNPHTWLGSASCRERIGPAT